MLATRVKQKCCTSITESSRVWKGLGACRSLVIRTITVRALQRRKRLKRRSDTKYLNIVHEEWGKKLYLPHTPHPSRRRDLVNFCWNCCLYFVYLYLPICYCVNGVGGNVILSLAKQKWTRIFFPFFRVLWRKPVQVFAENSGGILRKCVCLKKFFTRLLFSIVLAGIDEVVDILKVFRQNQEPKSAIPRKSSSRASFKR